MRHRVAVTLIAFCLISACGSPATPDLSPNEIVQRAAQAMLAHDTLHFKIDIDGPPASINAALGLGLRSAEGDFARPDRIGVHLKILSPLTAIEADMIALGEEQYITNFLTGNWESLPAAFGFNPAVMFHPEFGLEKTLEAGLDEAQLVGVESIDGGQAYHIQGALDGSRLQVMSGGLIGQGRVTVDLWIDPQTFNVRRAVLSDPSIDPEQPSVWTLTFSQFGKTVNLEPPID